MNRSIFRCSSLALMALAALAGTADPAVYRVGPGQKYGKVSEISSKLAAGDVVEVTGDIADNFMLTGYGTAEKPIVIRGVTGVENGRIVRPHIRSASPTADFIVKATGGWNIIEGLGLTGFMRTEWGKAALIHAAGNLVVRNCSIHHNIRAVYSDEEIAGDVLVEFCEFESNGYGPWGATSLFSKVPGAAAVVRHCYFHSNTGNHLLRTAYARNVIRYNWFEDPCHFAVQISTPMFSSDEKGQAQAERFLPAHSDIVGNVFLSGWRSRTYGALQIGGSAKEAAGTEGDFNIAHNLFVGRRTGAIPFACITTHGNVESINVYNNVMLDCRQGGLKVYLREATWDVPRTRAFKERRGTDEPTVRGSNNWISQGAYGIPGEFVDTSAGRDPGFFDLVNYDFRPTSASPLAGKGLWPLPEGRIASLVPEYEPRRGVPTDLKPQPRRKAEAPSVGPFEVTEEPRPFPDDSAALLLSVGDHGGFIQWQLPFAQARRKALEYLRQGKAHEALQCAKMQFILSPPDEQALNAAVAGVRQMLAAVDGNDSRAKRFADYARLGPAGEDGRSGTEDDLENPIADVPLDVFRRPGEFYDEFDRAIDARDAMGVEGASYAYWWEQRWYSTEKALARIDGGEFDDALGLLVHLLVDAVEKFPLEEGADVVEGEPGRTRNLFDRLWQGLSAVARGRGCSMDGAREFVRRCMECARYGPQGRDGVLGTRDDNDVGFAAGEPAAESAVTDARVASLKASHPDGVAVRLLEARLSSVAGARDRTVHRLDFIAAQAKAGHKGEFLYMLPTAAELLGVFLADFSGELTYAGLTPEESSIARSCVEGAIESADRQVVDAYKRLLASGVGNEAASGARAYLTAFVVGVHDKATYPKMLAMLAGQLADGKPPLFAVEDSAFRLNDPFIAAEVLDALDDWKEQKVPQGERTRLLAAIEEKQYDAVQSSSQRAKGMERGEAATEYRRALDRCVEHLDRFPTGRYASYMSYQKAYLKYRLEDYAEAVNEVKAFLAEYPQSPLLANALFVEGVARVGLGENQTGIETLAGLAAKYPQSNVASQALLIAGQLCITQGDYKRAREYLQRILDFYQKSPDAAKAKELLKKLEPAAAP